jgi:hypothetical protein
MAVAGTDSIKQVGLAVMMYTAGLYFGDAQVRNLVRLLWFFSGLPGTCLVALRRISSIILPFNIM